MADNAPPPSQSGAPDERSAHVALDRPPVELFVLDADSLRLIEANAAARRHVGLDDGLPTDFTLMDLVPGLTPENAAERLRSLREGRREELVVAAMQRSADGTTYPVEAHLSYTAEPSPRYIGSVLDISDRASAEKAAARLERIRDALAETLRAITRIDDREALYREACRIAVERGGFHMAWIGLLEPGDRAIRPVASAGHVDAYLDAIAPSAFDTHVALGITGTAIRQGRPVVVADIATNLFFEPWRQEAGVRGYKSVVALPLTVEGRTIGALMVYATATNAFDAIAVDLLERLTEDISFKIEVIGRDESRKSAEMDRDRLAAAVEQAAEIILITDRTSRIIYVNPAFTKLSGLQAAEVVGQTPEFLTGSLLTPEVAEAIPVALARGEVWSGRVRGRDKDGAANELDLSVSLRHDENGAVIGSTIIGRDVSREWALEAQLIQSQKLEAIGRFAGGIAHDFNNLLTAISGYAEILKSEIDAEDPRADDVAEILRASARAAELTGQLLAFSRQQILTPRALDAAAVVSGVTPMLRRLIGEDVELIVRSLPNAGPILADPGRLDQILVNLALNARDAMPTGGRLVIETGPVSLDEGFVREHVGSCAGPHVMFSVSDTGVGMTPEVRRRAFEPFFTTKAPGKGTGLGLSTVLGIVEQSNGYLWVDSVQGSGTTVRVYMPVVQPAPTSGELGPAQPRHNQAGTGTILVVEDEEPVRALVRRILEQAGYRVLSAASGDQALAIADEHAGTIDLLFTDVVMPGMNGREVAETLLLRRPATPVLYASGYNEEMVVERGALDPSISYIAKPYSGVDLLRRIQELVRKHEPGI